MPIVAGVDFGDRRDAALFRAIEELVDEGARIDRITVAARALTFTGADALWKVHGGDPLLYLLNEVDQHHLGSEPGIAIAHARVVAAAARAYNAQVVGEDLVERARRDPEGFWARLRELAREDESSGQAGGTLPPTAAEILRRLATLPPQKTFPTGFDELDSLLSGGLWARQVAVIVAPPGSGKTAFIGGLACNLAPRLPVLWVAAELDDEEQAARLAALSLGVPPIDILAGRVTPSSAADAIDGLAVHILELDVFGTPDPIAEIEARAGAIRAATGRAPAIIVDYLQALDVETNDRRRGSVGALAYRLRRLARLLDVPVVAISSTSRAFYGPARAGNGAEKRPDLEDPRAWLSAAKESGDIEFAAAVVGYLETGNPSEADPSNTPARLILAKVRRGRVGFIGLCFDGPTGRFTPSSAALAKMGRAAKQEVEDDAVLAAITATKGNLVAWREVRPRCGLYGKTADQAFVRLRQAGKIKVRGVKEVDAEGKPRGQRRDLVVLSEWASDPLPIGLIEVPR